MSTVSKVFLPDECKSYTSNEVLSLDEAGLFKLRRFSRVEEFLKEINPNGYYFCLKISSLAYRFYIIEQK